MAAEGLVSVIVPVFNAAPFLERCIDSILGQTYPNLELLLVDDGSTDGSERICDRKAREDSRIRVIHQENGGSSRARNRGLEEAVGEWVTFVDADDTLLENGLAQMMDRTSVSTDFIMACYEVSEEDGNIFHPVFRTQSSTLSPEQSMMMLYRKTGDAYLGYICAKLFRRSVLTAGGCRFDEDIVYNEDRLFVTQYLCSFCGSIEFTVTPVYRYYLGSGTKTGALKHTYDPRFYTDFQAFARMREMVRTRFPGDSDLYDLADSGVYHGYRTQKAYMRQFHKLSPGAWLRLTKETVGCIGTGKYLSYTKALYQRRLKKYLG